MAASTYGPARGDALYWPSNDNNDPVMRFLSDPRKPENPVDADFESTDAGWDPYVTALLMSETAPREERAGDEDDGVPVMSFSRGRGER